MYIQTYPNHVIHQIKILSIILHEIIIRLLSGHFEGHPSAAPPSRSVAPCAVAGAPLPNVLVHKVPPPCRRANAALTRGGVYNMPFQSKT